MWRTLFTSAIENKEINSFSVDNVVYVLEVHNMLCWYHILPCTKCPIQKLGVQIVENSNCVKMQSNVW